MDGEELPGACRAIGHDEVGGQGRGGDVPLLHGCHLQARWSVGVSVLGGGRGGAMLGEGGG